MSTLATRTEARRAGLISRWAVAGLNPRAIESFNIVLQPIAAQLTNLTLDYSGWSTPTGTHHLLGLLSACTGLRHLDLVSLSLRGNLFRFGPSPTYQLTTFSLSTAHSALDNVTGNHLEYLIGSSAASLETVRLDVDSLDDSVWATIDQLGLPLELRPYEHFRRWGFGIDSIISAVQQPSVRRLKVVVNNQAGSVDDEDWADVEQQVAEAMDRLADADRAKVELEMTAPDIGDDEDDDESDGGEVEEEDESEPEQGLQDIRQFFIRSTA